MELVGFKPTSFTAGGKEISKWVSKAGMEPKFIDGLRVTDAETMEIAEMVLNKVNKNLVRMARRTWCPCYRCQWKRRRTFKS